MMWEPTDPNALPSPVDLIHANIAIRETEEHLKDALRAVADAQRRVADLEKDLAQRRAWIAPIRRLSLDVLSLIFEFCGEDRWKTSFRISEVSRQWRGLVLSTPRAWALLDIRGLERATYMVDRYLKRSGQRPLHIYLPNSMPTRLLGNLENRLKCLSILHMSMFSEDCIFPILERLTLRSDYGCVEPRYFNRTRFPSLRHLQCKMDFRYSLRDSQAGILPSFPPLQTLSLQMTENSAWFSLLKACRSTLVSLKLVLCNYLPEEEPEITLPALRCLEIIYWANELGFWLLDLNTPVLECYLEISNEPSNDSPHHGDTPTVKKVRSDNPLPLAPFPLLEFLQLNYGLHMAIISQLESNVSLSPNLQQVEVESDGEWHDPTLTMRLEEVNRRRKVPVEVIFRRHFTDLPFAITNSPCGVNMPCNDEP